MSGVYVCACGDSNSLELSPMFAIQTTTTTSASLLRSSQNFLHMQHSPQLKLIRCRLLNGYQGGSDSSLTRPSLTSCHLVAFVYVTVDPQTGAMAQSAFVTNLLWPPQADSVEASRICSRLALGPRRMTKS